MIICRAVGLQLASAVFAACAFLVQTHAGWLACRVCNPAQGHRSGATSSGPATGPGVAIWQGPTGTVTSQIQAFVIWIPEPSTFALVGLGAPALMIFRRRQ